MSHIRVLFLVIMLNVGAFSFGQTESFHEKGSRVIVNSLQNSSDKYLRSLYNGIYYIPIWVNKSNLSYLATDLFREIKKDDSISKTSNLYTSFINIENLAQSIYLESNSSLSQKIALEFKN